MKNENASNTSKETLMAMNKFFEKCDNLDMKKVWLQTATLAFSFYSKPELELEKKDDQIIISLKENMKLENYISDGIKESTNIKDNLSLHSTKVFYQTLPAIIDISTKRNVKVSIYDLFETMKNTCSSDVINMIMLAVCNHEHYKGEIIHKFNYEGEKMMDFLVTGEYAQIAGILLSQFGDLLVVWMRKRLQQLAANYRKPLTVILCYFMLFCVVLCCFICTFRFLLLFVFVANGFLLNTLTVTDGC